MRYPTLTSTRAEELVQRLVSGESPPIAAEVTWMGTGEEIDLGPLDEAVAELQEDYAGFTAAEPSQLPEVFEGRASGTLHRGLRDLPVPVLDEPGFWRYVSLAKLWWFIRDRESGPIDKGNHAKYVDGLHPTECVPLRMFLRAQSIRNGEDYSLASSMDKATDFWRSHVIRVQTGSAPPLARSFAELQARVQMPSTPELRPYARRVNRLWTNVVLHQLDEEEATALLQELYDTRQVPGSPTGETP